MGAQSALGAARSDRGSRVRHRAALSGLQRPPCVDREFPGSGRKSQLCQSVTGCVAGRQARPDLQSHPLAISEIGWLERRMPPRLESMMTLAINDQRLAKPGPQNTAALRDYDCVRRAIAFISEHWRAQPTIEAMADAAGVTPDELHHLFRRWAGLTPKAFMQALTLDHAKSLPPH